MKFKLLEIEPLTCAVNFPTQESISPTFYVFCAKANFSSNIQLCNFLAPKFFVRKTLMKLTAGGGVNFTNGQLLLTQIPKAPKKTQSICQSFCAFGICVCKSFT